ncbi:hypothetical protein PFISCL1PPCAC_5628, partial [Pristionchus fissidentatus]
MEEWKRREEFVKFTRQPPRTTREETSCFIASSNVPGASCCRPRIIWSRDFCRAHLRPIDRKRWEKDAHSSSLDPNRVWMRPAPRSHEVVTGGRRPDCVSYPTAIDASFHATSPIDGRHLLFSEKKDVNCCLHFEWLLLIARQKSLED